MRLLSFSIPYSMGMADLSLIKLNSTGGGLELNVNRWRKQLDLSALNINEIETLREDELPEERYCDI